MLVIVVFLIGTLTFTLHKAVLESGHPMIEELPLVLRRGGGLVSLSLELAVLIVTLTLVRGGHGWAAAAYSVYGALNGLTAWLVLTRRI